MFNCEHVNAVRMIICTYYATLPSINQILAPVNLMLINLFICVLGPLVAHVTLEHAKYVCKIT